MLTTEQLMKKVPAAFATEPAKFVSDKYSFVPTYKILEVMQKQGFFAHSASQVSARSGPNLGKHMIRLRHESLKKTDVGAIPEIILINGHDWTTSYKLKGGIFRFVCSNGMIIASQEFGGVTRVHKGFDEDNIILASEEFLRTTGETLEEVGKFTDINLSRERQKSFSEDAAKFRWDYDGGEIEKMGRSLLHVRRPEDKGDDLWTVMNRTQENIMRGDFINPVTNRKVKAIEGVDANVRINTALWDLMENYALANN